MTGSHGTVPGGYQITNIQRGVVYPSGVQWSNVRERSSQPSGASITVSGSKKKTWGASQEFQYTLLRAEGDTLSRKTTAKIGC